MKQSLDQIIFKKNMHWAGTVGGAFQRSGLYKPGSLDVRKKEFREELRRHLESVDAKYSKVAITTNAHVRQINQLQFWSKQYKDILAGGKLNFGISQKLLNLHLKGLWCLGLLNYPPPHFPVDRIIQERLRLTPVIPWTKIKDEKYYLKIIEGAEVIARKNKIGLAELELQVYNGTLKIDR